MYKDAFSMFTPPDLFGAGVDGGSRKRMWIPPSRPPQPFGPVGHFGDVIDLGPHLHGPGEPPPTGVGPFLLPLSGGCPGLSGSLFAAYPNFMSAEPIGAGRGSFIGLIPNPTTGGADAFGF